MNNNSNFRQTLWLAIGQFCTFAISFVSAAILSRYLDKVEYGTYKQILYIYVTLQSLFTMGLPSVFSYFIPRLEKGQQKKLVSSINKVFLIIGCGLSILIFVLSDCIAAILENPELSNGLKIFSVFPLFTLPTMGVEGIYTAIRKTKELALYHIVSKIFMLICTVSPVIVIGANYKYAIIGWGGASFLTFMLAMYMKRRPYVGTEKKCIPNMYRDVFSYSTPLLGAFIGGFIISLADQFYISHYYGTIVFADYSNGCVNIPIAIMITSSVKNVLLPLLSKAEAEGNLEQAFKTYQNAVIKSIVLVFPILIFCFIYSTEIMIFLYGDQYSTSAVYMKSFIIREFTTILPYFSVLMALGMSKKYMNMHLWGALYIWTFGWIIVQFKMEPYLIVVTHSIFYILCTIYAFVCVYKYHRIKLVTGDIGKVILKVTLNCLVCGYISFYLINVLLYEFSALCTLIVSGFLFYTLLLLTGKILNINYLESIVLLVKKR